MLRRGRASLYTGIPTPRRGGRAAEGTRLLSEYGDQYSIAGSNPALSVYLANASRAAFAPTRACSQKPYVPAEESSSAACTAAPRAANANAPPTASRRTPADARSATQAAPGTAGTLTGAS